jgi:uncharacterized protein (DUF433 family)
MSTILTIEHIAIDPEKRGGKPYIKGTGITVHDIAGDYNSGMSVEHIAQAFDLTPGQVHAALSYYWDHKAQIDQEIREGGLQTSALLDELKRQGKATSAEELRRRIQDRRTGR